MSKLDQAEIEGVVIEAEVRSGSVLSSDGNAFVACRFKVRRVAGGDLLLPWMCFTPRKAEELVAMLAMALEGLGRPSSE
jgi:hypothetical protein